MDKCKQARPRVNVLKDRFQNLLLILSKFKLID